MRKIKRLFSLMLAMLMLLTALPAMGITVNAATEAVPNANITVESAPSVDAHAVGTHTPPVLLAANGALVTTGNVTRAAWLHNLALIFDMTVEADSVPDNYFSDLPTTHTYYEDVLLAINFGVVDIEAGEALLPDGALTRDFAAWDIK